MKSQNFMRISTLLTLYFIFIASPVLGIAPLNCYNDLAKGNITYHEKSLIDNIKLGNVDQVRLSVDPEADPDISDSKVKTSFVASLWYSHAGVVLTMSSANVNPNNTWQDIKSKLREAARYIKENEILDAGVKSLLSEIPFVGGLVGAYWDNVDLGQAGKAMEVAEFLERLSNQQEAHFETIVSYLDNQKQELKEGKRSLNGLLDDVAKLMKIAKRIEETADATRENTEDLKRMLILLISQVDRINKKMGISSASEAFGARVSLSESDRMKIDENERVYQAIRETGITINPTYSYQMGLLAVSQRRYLQSEHHFKEALSVDSKYADAYTGLALVYQMRANEMLGSGDFGLVERLLKQAEMNIDNALRLDHFDLKALLQSGYVFKDYGQHYIRMGQPDKAAAPLDTAKKHFEFVLKEDPQNSGAYNGLGNIYYLRNDLDKAITHYKKAIQITPNYLFAHHDLAAAYYRKGKNDTSVRRESYEKAIEEFRKALQLNEHQHSLDPLYVTQIHNLIKGLSNELN